MEMNMRIACLGPGMLNLDLVLLQWDIGSQTMFLSGAIPWSNLSPDSAPVSRLPSISRPVFKGGSVWWEQEAGILRSSVWPGEASESSFSPEKMIL